MRKLDHIASLPAGFGIGAAATLLSVPEAGWPKPYTGHGPPCGRWLEKVCRKRLAMGQLTFSRERKLTGTQEEIGRQNSMNDMKDKAKKKIDDAAAAARKAADKVVDKSKDVAHSAGKKMEEGGKRLRDA